MASMCEATTRIVPGAAVIELSGDIDGSAAAILTGAYDRAVTGHDSPEPIGTVVLDFNRAANLPCAFTDLATCPLPPAENRLPIAIEAGEKIPYERLR